MHRLTRKLLAAIAVSLGTLSICGLAAEPVKLQAGTTSSGQQSVEQQVTQLNNQVAQLTKQGRWQEAEALAEKAVVLGRPLGDNPHFAVSLNNLAAFYFTTGRYNEAFALLRKGLEIRQRILGEAHPDYAANLLN